MSIKEKVLAEIDERIAAGEGTGNTNAILASLRSQIEKLEEEPPTQVVVRKAARYSRD